MGKSDDKTNVCRVLDQKKVSYKTHVCPDAEGLSGDEIAAVLNENPEQAFKTLVTVGKTGKNWWYFHPPSQDNKPRKPGHYPSRPDSHQHSQVPDTSPVFL